MKKKIFCHLSFDDSESAFGILRETGSDSLESLSYFRNLIRLNRRYGAKFTLYLFNTHALDGLDPGILTELSDASSWLRFSYHGNDTDLNDGSFLEDFSECTKKVSDLLGEKSLSDILRIHRFNVDSLTAAKLGGKGIRILLSADDDRKCQALNDDQNGILSRKGELLSDGVCFWKTDVRLERDYWKTMFEAWKERECPHIVVFSHEQLVSGDEARLEELIRRMEWILDDLETSFEVSFL